jgi:hypothetical protein
MTAAQPFPQDMCSMGVICAHKHTSAGHVMVPYHSDCVFVLQNKSRGWLHLDWLGLLPQGQTAIKPCDTCIPFSAAPAALFHRSLLTG